MRLLLIIIRPCWPNANVWHMLGICMACWGKNIGPTSNQPLRCVDEQNDVEPTSFVNVGPTILPTNWHQFWSNE